MRIFLRLLIILIVAATIGTTIYGLLQLKENYVPKEKEEAKVIVPNNEKEPSKTENKKPEVKKPEEPKKEEKKIEDIKVEDILSLSGDEDKALSLEKIRKDNIDDLININISSNVQKSFNGEIVPFDIYGSLVNTSLSDSGEYKLSSTLNGVKANVQVAGTMISIVPEDESQDRIEFHYLENGKLAAYVRHMISEDVKSIIYFDENEMPFEHSFDTDDKDKIYTENYKEVYNRAKKAYNQYFIKEEN